jgi:hypothetical protein
MSKTHPFYNPLSEHAAATLGLTPLYDMNDEQPKDNENSQTGYSYG